jgi:glycolate oxidase subunit GlcD
MIDGLRAIVGYDYVLGGANSRFASDASRLRARGERARAVVCPGSPAEVASVVSWCYAHDIPMTPRGGGTGLAGGAVAVNGEVVVSMDRLNQVRSFDPLLWRIHVDAGLSTRTLRRVARENGLVFPPDPGAADQSQIGGNIATNAGGPHAFKYGSTGSWVTGLEVVLPPGDLVNLGGPNRKDVASYDLKKLVIGSEGTLGIVTGAWLRLIPAPESSAVVLAFYPSVETGLHAVHRVLGTGEPVAALEYLDEPTLRITKGSFPGPMPDSPGFLVAAELDGSSAEVARMVPEVRQALDEEGASHVTTLQAQSGISALWRWRDGVSGTVSAHHNGKVSADICVPLDMLAAAINQVSEISARHHLAACTWGHAGDGNIHANFLVDLDDTSMVARSELALADLFAVTRGLGGSITGEHGIGWLKRKYLVSHLEPAVYAAHLAIKYAFDPKNLMNPGKKV